MSSRETRYSHHAMPSLSSSISSSSSYSMPLSPVSPPRQQPLKQPTVSLSSSSSAEPGLLKQHPMLPLRPQRSASAGSLLRQQQQYTTRHNSYHAPPLRPASWVVGRPRNSSENHRYSQYSHESSHHKSSSSRASSISSSNGRRVSFNACVTVISSQGQPEANKPETTTTTSSSNSSSTTTKWWDESQLAMELAEDDLLDQGRKKSAHRLKQKLGSIISIHSSSSSISSSSSSSIAGRSSFRKRKPLEKKQPGRFVRSFKRLVDIVFQLS